MQLRCLGKEQDLRTEHKQKLLGILEVRFVRVEHEEQAGVVTVADDIGQSLRVCLPAIIAFVEGESRFYGAQGWRQYLKSNPTAVERLHQELNGCDQLMNSLYHLALALSKYFMNTHYNHKGPVVQSILNAIKGADWRIHQFVEDGIMHVCNMEDNTLYQQRFTAIMVPGGSPSPVEVNMDGQGYSSFTYSL